MNARKVLTVLGIILLVIVAAIIAVSLLTVKKVETEANRNKTQAARDARWKREKENPDALSETESPAEPLDESDFQDDINPDN